MLAAMRRLLPVPAVMTSPDGGVYVVEALPE